MHRPAERTLDVPANPVYCPLGKVPAPEQAGQRAPLFVSAPGLIYISKLPSLQSNHEKKVRGIDGTAKKNFGARAPNEEDEMHSQSARCRSCFFEAVIARAGKHGSIGACGKVRP
ncbi:hypothetical protein WKW77_05590 [Variovorax ureilyticus]|uniref:Uncharacterized protein n=1 Tax=Variovorax ureilyticus TaxID=1836198 RepID=A0ABU8VA51_9BURK